MVTITFKRPYCKTGTIEEDKKTTKGDKRPLSTLQVPLKSNHSFKKWEILTTAIQID